MANTLGDYAPAPVRATGINTVISRCVVAVGATGAPTADADQGWTVTRNSTGSYAIVFPAVSANARAILMHGIGVSAAATVARTYASALALTSGTATLITYLNTAGTPVDPANGDSFWLELHATIGGATP